MLTARMLNTQIPKTNANAQNANAQYPNAQNAHVFPRQMQMVNIQMLTVQMLNVQIPKTNANAQYPNAQKTNANAQNAEIAPHTHTHLRSESWVVLHNLAAVVVDLRGKGAHLRLLFLILHQDVLVVVTLTRRNTATTKGRKDFKFQTNAQTHK